MQDIVHSTDDYLSLILSLPGYSPETVMSLFFLTCARLAPVVAFSPFLGAKSIPNAAKFFLVIVLCAIYLPSNLLNIQGEITFSTGYILFLFKELLIGFFIGFLAAFPFYVVQSSGSLIDHMRGSSSLQVQDPTTQSQTGPLGIIYNYVLILAFYALDGPYLLFTAVGTSFKVVPVDQFVNTAFFSTSFPFWQKILGLFSQLMQMAIRLAAPSLVGILMAEMFLGIANRLAPNVQIVFLGIPIKSWLGVGLLLLAWHLVIHEMGRESLTWIKSIDNIFYQMIPIQSL